MSPFCEIFPCGNINAKQIFPWQLDLPPLFIWKKREEEEREEEERREARRILLSIWRQWTSSDSTREREREERRREKKILVPPLPCPSLLFCVVSSCTAVLTPKINILAYAFGHLERWVRVTAPGYLQVSKAYLKFPSPTVFKTRRRRTKKKAKKQYGC